jgi:hypothetical protein
VPLLLGQPARLFGAHRFLGPFALGDVAKGPQPAEAVLAIFDRRAEALVHPPVAQSHLLAERAAAVGVDRAHPFEKPGWVAGLRGRPFQRALVRHRRRNSRREAPDVEKLLIVVQHLTVRCDDQDAVEDTFRQRFEQPGLVPEPLFGLQPFAQVYDQDEEAVDTSLG